MHWMYSIYINIYLYLHLYVLYLYVYVYTYIYILGVFVGKLVRLLRPRQVRVNP